MALFIVFASDVLARQILLAPELAGAMRVTAAVILLGAIGVAQIGILTGLESFRQLAVLNTTKGVIGGAILVGAARHYALIGCIWALIAVEALGVVMGEWILRRECRRSGLHLRARGPRIDGDSRAVVRFSIAALLSSLATMPAFWIARVWLVRGPDGFFQAGLFEAANKWALALLFLPTAVAAAQLPMLSYCAGVGDNRAYRRLFVLNVALTVASCVIPGIGLALVARPLMGLNGLSYQAGANVLAVLALSSALVALNTSLGQGFVSRGIMRVRLLVDWGLAGCLTLLSWVLVPRYGAMGLAIASAAAFGVASAVLAVLDHFMLRSFRRVHVV